MPEKDFIEMRKFAVKLLGKHLDELLDSWDKENQIDEDTYEKWRKEHIHSSYKSEQ